MIFLINPNKPVILIKECAYFFIRYYLWCFAGLSTNQQAFSKKKEFIWFPNKKFFLKYLFIFFSIYAYRIVIRRWSKKISIYGFFLFISFSWINIIYLKHHIYHFTFGIYKQKTSFCKHLKANFKISDCNHIKKCHVNAKKRILQKK